MNNNPFKNLPPPEPPTLMEDGLEFHPDEQFEFQTSSGIVISHLRFSDLPKYGFLNIVRKHDKNTPVRHESFSNIMCQVIQRCDEHKLEEILRHTSKYNRGSFISETF